MQYTVNRYYEQTSAVRITFILKTNKCSTQYIDTINKQVQCTVNRYYEQTSAVHITFILKTKKCSTQYIDIIKKQV